MAKVLVDDDIHIYNTKKQSTKKTLSWVEKYRPSDITDIVDHKDRLDVLNKFIELRKFKNVIFYGPPGVGKTTTALACGKKLFGECYRDIIVEKNGSDTRGIDEIRDDIKSYATKETLATTIHSGIDNSMKFIILDECDNMTENAQYALKSVIQNTSANARFCLICNYETKILPHIKSLCIPLLFSPVSRNEQFKLVKHIVIEEQVKISDDSINTIIDLSNGDMRRSINLLEQLHTSHGIDEITDEVIYKYNCNLPPSIRDHMLNNIFDKKVDLSTAIIVVNKIKIENGLTTKDILDEIVKHIRKNIRQYDAINMLSALGAIEPYQTKAFNSDLFLANMIATVKKYC